MFGSELKLTVKGGEGVVSPTVGVLFSLVLLLILVIGENVLRRMDVEQQVRDFMEEDDPEL